MEFMLGGIISFGGNFAPKDWAFCDGQLIAISQNQALFAILGTTWGGDGRTNFALPNLQSRVPVGAGQRAGFASRRLGQEFGAETVSLTTTQLPTHTHDATFTGTGGISGTAPTATVTVNANSGNGNKGAATGNYWASTPGGLGSLTSYSDTKNITMASDAVSVTVSGGGGSGITGGSVAVAATGGGQAFTIWQPSLAMNFLLAVQGTFPSRN